MKSILDILLRELSLFVPGANDEDVVAKTLSQELNPDDYVILNHINLLTTKKTVTQIDHIIVSKYGIFCVETQHHLGWIFGNPKVDEWKQVVDNKKHNFPNPIKQNDVHVKAIKRTLGWRRIKAPVQSLVVFPSAYRLFIDDTDRAGNIDHMLGKIQEGRAEVYKSEEVLNIVDKIKLSHIPDKVIIDERKREVAERVSNSTAKVKKLIRK